MGPRKSFWNTGDEEMSDNPPSDEEGDHSGSDGEPTGSQVGSDAEDIDPAVIDDVLGGDGGADARDEGNGHSIGIKVVGGSIR